MADYTLNILRPSVNNLTARIFVRAAGLDFEEIDVWGKTMDARVPRQVPAAPDADARGARPWCAGRSARAARSWPTCATSTASISSTRPIRPSGRMVDNAMFYLIGTLYPYLARATYPTLGFPQYAGEVGAVGGGRRAQGAGPAGREGRARRPARAPTSGTSSPTGGSSAATRRRSPTSAWRRRSSSCARSTTSSRRWVERVHERRWRTRSATRTPSPPPTCAGSSSR